MVTYSRRSRAIHAPVGPPIVVAFTGPLITADDIRDLVPEGQKWSGDPVGVARELDRGILIAVQRALLKTNRAPPGQKWFQRIERQINALRAELLHVPVYAGNIKGSGSWRSTPDSAPALELLVSHLPDVQAQTYVGTEMPRLMALLSEAVAVGINTPAEPAGKVDAMGQRTFLALAAAHWDAFGGKPQTDQPGPRGTRDGPAIQWAKAILKLIAERLPSAGGTEEIRALAPRFAAMERLSDERLADLLVRGWAAHKKAFNRGKPTTAA